jgi:threonine dehydratase
LITFQDIEAARKRIAAAVYYSPCPLSIPLSEITRMQIFCKLDNLQRTGSFKERGARNALAQLSAAQQKRGVMPLLQAITLKHWLIRGGCSEFLQQR